MTKTAAELDLTASFDPATEQQWLDLVTKALKGADFDKRLVSRTADGLALQPLYGQAADAGIVAGANAGQPWRVGQRMDHPDPEAANGLALTDLENGVDTLTIVGAQSHIANGYGVVISGFSDVESALRDVSLDMVTLRLEAGRQACEVARLIAEFVGKAGLDATDLSVQFGLAPLADLMRRGRLDQAWPDVTSELADTMGRLQDKGFGGSFLDCDVRPVHDAGGSEAQELAVALASGVAYMRALGEQGLDATTVADAMRWTVAVDADQILSIAKLRALRLLWRRVREASGLAQQPMDIHAETAWRMMSACEPGVNMLRTTMATAAAAIGGADGISVLPFTIPLGLPDAFARRMARNTQIVLMEESNLWRVADPAAGSGALEAVTDELCMAAWSVFQDIEREGGLVESLRAGTLQKRIAESRLARARDVARRKIPLTGTSEFPNLDGHEENVLRVPRPERPADTGGESGLLVQALPAARLSEPFETLRAASDAHLNRTGKRATVFLANLGTLAEYGTRTTWIRNLLAVGGLDVVSSEGLTNSADAGRAFADSESTVACLCGTDAGYEELGEATASALKGAGAGRVYLAGRPGDSEPSLAAAGVDSYLYAGIDVVAALHELQEALGVE